MRKILSALVSVLTFGSCASVTSIGVTNPAEVAHVALGYGKLAIVTVDGRGYTIGGKNREYFIVGPGEHVLEVRMFGYYQSTTNAKVKIYAKPGQFILLCPLKDISPFSKTGNWVVLPLYRASQSELATTNWPADGYEDYSGQCGPWTSVVEEQDVAVRKPGHENYWKTTNAARDFRDPEGRSVVDLAKSLKRPNRAAELAEAGY